jgi:Antirepressor regulating drug resistance, predicted signal transduction N-terminal membrane component
MLQTIFENVIEVSLTISAVIVILLLLLPWIHKKYSYKWRYWVWLVLAVRLLIPFNLSLPKAPIKLVQPSYNVEFNIPVQNGAPGQMQSNTSGLQPAEDSTAVRTVRTVTLSEMLPIVWVLGIALFLLYHISGYLLFRRSILHFSRPIEDRQIAEMWLEMKDKLKIRKDIEILLCKNIQSPMMTGFFKPVLLLPGLDFKSSELKIILNHELIHYKRRDIWYKLLLTCANGIHWFNPLVYIMAAISNKDIEMVCDSEMVKSSDAAFRKEYGETILSAVRKGNLRRAAFSTNFYGGKKTMKERFSNIFDMGKKRRGIMTLCILLVIVFAASGLIACQEGIASARNSSGTQVPGNNTSQPNTGTVVSGNDSNDTVKPSPETTVTPTPGNTVTISTTGGVTPPSSVSSQKVGAVVYKNTQYGFDFSLPESWKGYKIVSDQWTGTSNGKTVNGPEIIIRNPLWTSSNTLQDIPIMVFTLSEWAAVVKGPSQKEGETLFIGAGPNGPTEIARNSKYVFALPFRYDFGGEGVEEVHIILSQNPLKPTENISAAKK